MGEGQELRNLTDDDVTAVVDEMEKRLVRCFFSDVGRGVSNSVWRSLAVLMIVLAAYGAVKS